MKTFFIENEAVQLCVTMWKRPSWFVLGAMPAIGHVVLIWIHFKKRNEMK